MANGAVIQPPVLPLPLRAIQVDPPKLGTADCAFIARCDDNLDYAIKDTHTNVLVPHSEWFCTQLAELLGIACPPPRVVQMPDGSLVFGSRWEGGVIAPKPAPQWWELVQQDQIKLDAIEPILTRLYAFDHFVHNIDRHAGNFLVRQQKSGHAILAFDFSRAWITHGFPLPPPPIAGNTVTAQRQFSALWKKKYIDPKEAKKFLDGLKTVPVANVQKIIEQHPGAWIAEKTKGDLIKWWSSSDFVKRIESIVKGIDNGTYL